MAEWRTPQTQLNVKMSADELARVKALQERLQARYPAPVKVSVRMVILEALDALEARLRAQEGRQVAVTPPHVATGGAAFAPAESQRSHVGDDLALPDGWVSLHELAMQHGISHTLAGYHVRQGHLPAHAGSWKSRGSGKGWVKHALDADGQATFHRLGLARIRAPDCPFCQAE